MRTDPSAVARLSPWRMVVGLGLVSLAADMVADGGKSIYGPLLGSLGASALVVGLVTGAAEAVSLLLRLAVGPAADRRGNHWSWTITGYALTAVCIPLLAVAPLVGKAGLVLAATLIIVERAGKALRSPSKSALLAHAAGAVGRGKGFGVHKVLDLVGAMSGPLVVAAVVAVTGEMSPALLVLLVPGVATMVLLAWLRRRVPDPSVYDPAPVRDDDASDEAGAAGEVRVTAAPADGATAAGSSGARARRPGTTALRGWGAQSVGAGLPREFFLFAVACALATGGLVSYGITGYHLVQDGLVPLAVAPLVFAGAMGAGAVAAVATGWAYDRRGGAVLLVLPFLVAAVPPLALSARLSWVLVGAACWGAAGGLQDATVKALVADLVPAPRRATAYGVFAAIQGVAALVGGATVGALYDVSVGWLTVVVGVAQAAALVLLLRVTRTSRAGSRA